MLGGTMGVPSGHPARCRCTDVAHLAWPHHQPSFLGSKPAAHPGRAGVWKPSRAPRGEQSPAAARRGPGEPAVPRGSQRGRRYL